MPLLGDTDLWELILHNLEEYSDSGEIPAYDTDFIIGFAESQLPIYYNEIVQEWSDLPAEYRDTWHDYGTEDNTTIYDLMTRDLYNYYETRTSKILDQIQEERNNGQTR
jgi:hypothetical protein